MLLCIGLIGGHHVFSAEDRLASIKQKIRKEFSSVAQLSTQRWQDMLAQQVQAGKVNNIILLDVREPEEFNVSHLKQAQLTPDLDTALTVLHDAPKNALIVAYCSVGYRSSALVEKLAKQGYVNAYNLEGSLFEWANRGLPVYLAGKRVYKVHPYSFWWGRYLRKDYHP